MDIHTNKKQKNVVILGAGFGGVYTAQALLPMVRRNEINLTIINETNYFLFTPLLHEVATGSLSPQSAAESLREMFANEDVLIIQGTVDSIDQNNNTVQIRNNCSVGIQPEISIGHANTDNKDSVRHINYDFLVLATGATTNYFGNKSAEVHSLPLKNLADALRIKDRIIEVFEKAPCAPNNSLAAKSLSFTVIGGGPTGVETVAELAEFVYGMHERYTKTATRKAKRGDVPTTTAATPQVISPKPLVTLISSGKSILEQFHPSLRTRALKRLENKGVRIILEAKAEEIGPDYVALADGTKIPSTTTIWVAGVRPQAPVFINAVQVHKNGRLVIDRHFRLIDHENIFALGDAATPLEGPLPMLAQVAVGQARIVARNITTLIHAGNGNDKGLFDFTYRSKGSLVSIGQRFAIGELHRLRISGMIAWWLWRTVYLFKFVSWQKRFRIMFEWTLALFSPRDITKAN